MSLKGPYSLRCGLTIYPAQDHAIDRVLGELFDRCPAQFILLADQSGQLITVYGDRGKTNIVGLAALVAADMAASQEIARMSGQYDTCQLVLREGQCSYSFISECGKHLVLFVQTSQDTPLGWARMLILKTAAHLEEIVAQRPSEVEQEYKLDLGTPDALNDLFGDAFNAVWTDNQDEY